jgi:hypothetical protein
MELDGRAIGDLAQPNVEILSLSRFEEKNVVAVVKLGQLVQFVQLSLGVELGILSAVREHRRNIVEKMAMSVGDTSGREDQNPLLVLLDAIARRLSLGVAGLRDRFVDGSHFVRISTMRLVSVVEKKLS